jgi:ArsR family transcriptional regulator
MKPAAIPLPVDQVFRAFSDRTRIRILRLLQDGELCVGDIVAVLGVPQAKTSRHLAYLRRTGLVVTRQDGPWSFYALAAARGAIHAKLLECLGACLREVPELAADARRARALRRSGGCCPDRGPRCPSR